MSSFGYGMMNAAPVAGINANPPLSVNAAPCVPHVGYGYNMGAILVLFILLVIILRTVYV